MVTYKKKIYFDCYFVIKICYNNKEKKICFYVTIKLVNLDILNNVARKSLILFYDLIDVLVLLFFLFINFAF